MTSNKTGRVRMFPWKRMLGAAASFTGLLLIGLPAALRAEKEVTQPSPAEAPYHQTDHTVIFVHGRSAGTDHSPALLQAELGSFETSGHGWQPRPPLEGEYWEWNDKIYPAPHVCQSGTLNEVDQYRCRMRIDIRGYWKTLGASSKLDYHYDGLMAQMARDEDFRSSSGDCSVRQKLKDPGLYEHPFNPGRFSELIGGNRHQYICKLPNFSVNGADPQTDPASNLNDCHYSDPNMTRAWEHNTEGVAIYDGCNHRTQEAGSAVQTQYGPDSVLPGPTTYYVPNAVFVGYHGDSSPRDTTNPYGALQQLDDAMWHYCDAAANKTCTILCHSAGCYVVGKYLAMGWGPGYHNQSGLIDVISTNSAAGGSQISLRARECRNFGWGCPEVAEAFQGEEIWTPMIQALVPDAAMSEWTHGEQYGEYSTVPTYYLAGTASELPGALQWALGWGDVVNDGAVSLRSQCAGLGSDDDSDVYIPGYDSDDLDANVCKHYSERRDIAGYGHGRFFAAMDWYSAISVNDNGCSQDLKTCPTTHPNGRRVAVQYYKSF